MIETKEEKYVLQLATRCGWETIYCYFNNKQPYNCIGQSIRFPTNTDSNGMIWICDNCIDKLVKRINNETLK